MYDRKWLRLVEETEATIPNTESWISQVSSPPTRSLLRDQLARTIKDFYQHLAEGSYINDDARRIAELGVLAFELVEEARAERARMSAPSPSKG